MHSIVPNCAPNAIVHTGREFIFCLEGQLTYTIEDQVLSLEPSKLTFKPGPDLVGKVWEVWQPSMEG